MGCQSNTDAIPAFATRESLVKDLKKLGISDGCGVFVHSSLKSIGPVVGGARAVVNALIDTVGAEGLLAMPGFSTDAYLPTWLDPQKATAAALKEIQAAVPGHDSRISSCRDMGLIAETFRT